MYGICRLIVIRPVVESYICFSWTFLTYFGSHKNWAYFDLLQLHLLPNIDICEAFQIHKEFATNANILHHHLSQFDPHHGFDLNLFAPEKRQKIYIFKFA